MKEFFSEEKILSKKPPYYHTLEVPDVWFSAELVWEIRGAGEELLTCVCVHSYEVKCPAVLSCFVCFLQELWNSFATNSLVERVRTLTSVVS